MDLLKTNYRPGDIIKSSDYNAATTIINTLLARLDTFATIPWVLNLLYLLQHQSLADYAKTADLEGFAKTEDLSSVATSGDYEDLLNKPDIDLSVFDLVSVLPTGDAINTNKVYLLKDASATEGDVDTYDQWKYIDGTWSKLGSYKTSVDLSGYVEKLEGKGLFSGSYNDLTNKPNLNLYVTLATDQTVSGNKTFTNAVKIQGDGHIQSTTDSGAIRLFGGTSLGTGASFIFHGKDYNSDYWKGSFDIIAHNGTAYKQLTGKPDGTLTWTGNTIFVKNNTNTGAIRVDNGDSVVVSDTRVYIRPTNETNNYGNGHGVCFDFTDKDVTPETNKEISLGEPNHQFNNIYGNTIYQNGNLVANKEDLNSYETSQHASDTYVKKSAISTKELVFIKEDGSTETVKSIVEV